MPAFRQFLCCLKQHGEKALLSIWSGYLKEQEVRYVWENGTGVVARDDSQVDVLWMSACL